MRLTFILVFVHVVCSDKWTNMAMTPLHLKHYISSRQDLREICAQDDSCPLEKKTLDHHCWGYESNCPFEKTYTHSLGLGTCEKGNEKNRDLFFERADFGYVAERSNLLNICESEDEEEDSSLRCAKDLRYCYAKNIFFDFRSFSRKGSKMYRNDIVQEGEVGGHCQKKFNREILKENAGTKSYLQTWAAEFQHFSSVSDFKVDGEHCDVVFDRPTVVMKLDAAVNMYHHFCDFMNLYASQHINGSFGRDVHIVWWETGAMGFKDTTFGVTWKAFSHQKPVELISLAGKRVCFREAMFPLLARQSFGLYYNMPMVPGCQGSGLVHAFSHHILHRLGISPSLPQLEEVRVTILSRKTQFRRILNIEELESAASRLPGVRLSVVEFDHGTPFEEQLAISHNSDVFLGIHGAGLTHLLFLPDWAAVFELYHCEDRGCYKDLARLRGVKYFTWPDDKMQYILPEVPEGKDGSHKKFINYRFDKEEFKRQLAKVVEWVRRNPKFVDARRKLRRRLREEL